MIEADFTKRRGSVRLTVQGHAGYSESGGDIVCAAVSGIFYALCGYLKNRMGEGLYIRSIRSGYADIECTDEGEEAMKLACIGLLQIALTYPGCLSVSDRAFDWRVAPLAD